MNERTDKDCFTTRLDFFFVHGFAEVKAGLKFKKSAVWTKRLRGGWLLRQSSRE